MFIVHNLSYLVNFDLAGGRYGTLAFADFPKSGKSCEKGYLHVYVYTLQFPVPFHLRNYVNLTFSIKKKQFQFGSGPSGPFCHVIYQLSDQQSFKWQSQTGQNYQQIAISSFKRNFEFDCYILHAWSVNVELLIYWSVLMIRPVSDKYMYLVRQLQTESIGVV